MINKRGFCAALKSIRKTEKLSLKQVEKRSGIDSSQLSKIEHGAFPSKITTIAKIQQGLGLTNERLLGLLGFKNKEYVNIPVINAYTKNFGQALAHARTLAMFANHAPKNAFFLKVQDEMAPLIHKGSYALIDRNFKYLNGKFYAVLLDHKIMVGKAYMSEGHTYGVLITNEKSYFNMDYLGRYRVLGRVIRISDSL